MTIQKPRDLKLPPVPTFTRKAIETVTIIVTAPIAAMLITVWTAIHRCVPEPTDHDGRSIDTNRKIGMSLSRNTGAHTRNCQSSAGCNE
jgi:hypothetical protein